MRTRRFSITYAKLNSFLTAAAACLVLFISSRGLCGAPRELVVVSPHWEGIKSEFTREFKSWYRNKTGETVSLTWLDQGGTSDVLKFIKSRFAENPDGIGIDLFWGGGIDPYVELARKGLLARYAVPDSILKNVPAALNGVPLYDPDRRWYGSSLAGFGVLYNRKLIKMLALPPVREWEDLAAPSLAGWVGSGDPRHSGSVHIIYEIILQSYGWEKGWGVILRMGGNVNTFPQSSGQTGKDLAAGEIAYGVCIDTYAYSAIQEAGEENLGFVLPAGATAITPDPIAILKGAPNAEPARAFVRFILLPKAQKIWMYKAGVRGGPAKFPLNKMSILPGLYGDLAGKSYIGVNPFTHGEKVFRYDFEKGTARWGVLNDLIGAFVIDTHDELAAAWKRASKSTRKTAEFARFPVSEEQAGRLAPRWQDPVLRNRKINEWLRTAKKKYSAI
ncbi:MAG: extracellular solute-binding protein [bacterium]